MNRPVMNTTMIMAISFSLIVGIGVGYILGYTLDLSHPSEELESLRQQVRALEISVDNLSSQVDSLSSQVTNQQTQIINLQIRASELQSQIDSTKAFELMKKELASPGGYIADLVVDELVSELRTASSQFEQWLGLVGETVVKEALESAINANMPGFVWNNVEATSQGSRQYYVMMITYFPIDLDTGFPIIGTITVARIALVVSGIVDVVSESVSNISIESLEVA